MPRTSRRRAAGVAAATLMMAGASLLWAQPAAAVTSKCTDGEMCFHFNSAQYGYGATYGQAGNIRSLNPSVNGGINYYFTADAWGSSGAGRNVWNNAGGARNRNASLIMLSFVNSGCTGAQDAIGARTARTLNFTYNNNASACWVS